MSVSNEQVLAMLGRIDERLEGLTKLTAERSHAFDRRLDDKFSDLKTHLSRQDKRLDALDERINEAHSIATEAKTTQTAAVKSGAASGAGAGALLAIAIELIRDRLLS